MAAQLVEIVGVFRREKFRRDDWIIAEIKTPSGGDSCGLLTIKGNADIDELVARLEYRFYGRHENHPKYGRSFAFKTFVMAQPHGRSGTIRYLQQVPGIGPATASALWHKFQGQAVRVLRETPEVAAAAVESNRFTVEKATEAAAKLKEMAALEDCTIDLIDLLGGRRFPKDTPRAATKVWGNRAAKFIRRDPFLLRRFRGCGFMLCDQMYLDLDGNPAKLKRQALCLLDSMERDSDGHTWYSQEHIVSGLKAKISGTAVRGPEAALLARRAGIIATRRDAEGKLWFAEKKKADAEAYVARHLAAAMLEDAVAWPNVNELDESLSDHQREQLAKALAGVIGSLGGSPGTGKTYSAAALIKAIGSTCGFDQIVMCAPTGKAAVRLTEMMAEYDLNFQAVTIHRLLKVVSAVNGGWMFEYNELNPLPYRFIIVDESSMIDTTLLSHFLAARAKGTHVLFVSDIHQLPPVSHGAPLRDMIIVGVSYGELTEIHRNAGRIVRACKDIRAGREFAVSERVNLEIEQPENLKLIPAANGKAARERIVAMIKNIRDQGLCNPIWDAQVVVAVNKKSPLSRKELNRLIQDELNPGEKIGTSPFRVHDKVIQLKNGFLPAVNDGAGNEDGKFFVANGDMGRVTAVQDKLTEVAFESPKRLVKIFRAATPAGGNRGNNNGNNGGEDDTGCDLDLAYAVTCHKLQGSEAPVVIVALDEYAGARRVCSREWLYTAISRAKRVCYLIGKISTAYGMIRRQALNKRKTFLSEQITECLKELQPQQAPWEPADVITKTEAETETPDLRVPLIL